ncbi:MULTISPECIES: glycerophosphodiester phosphodiesterase family protein [Rhizobium]|uniref:Glycerophosphodiester phosphodiesterase family protein n=1 Tax=Rhizobium rhododendri TaxID=2506430 RepID=A0ABY8IRV1_9HYPH|nr:MULTISPECIES: glycerophosphodiester phosphodiesterase family protein [Rhizobium]MBZ5763422.1 glycerophosphodiester phosphodiesterase family protein [Rhizobium sp. VS19-DR96]MBZ5769317.1 glycerophosphodiester phosphodiesterase family protein [Rhizobium sp. VS19-DR129.2]MBZ5776874.1 glycerophosphodiester phosphodiesterase family protein [Rhizobium sp. VS19-DRK62.2]MBZ5787985.1 glycerophosphodiester phosphodiesterase family protein [Rhizobium sp. VS19-DR121]MBZ5805466.1 glycerophosphodiester p
MRIIGILISITALTAPMVAQSQTVLPVKISPYLVSSITGAMFGPPDPASDLVLLSAHRGLWETYPENSAYALQEAWNAGIESVEIDVRFTSDKEVVLSHDFTIERESTGSGAIYDQTYTQLKNTNLRDRHGRVFKDPSGKNAKFLTFSDALDLLAQYISTDGYGYVMIVDVKSRATGTGSTDAIELIQRCLDILSAKNNPKLSKAVVIKTKARDAVDLATFLNRTTYDPTSLGGLVLTTNPDDVNVKDSSYDPHQDVAYTQWNTAPFPVQFEMNQYYRGDGLQKYFDYVDQKQSFSTYHESNTFPEGVPIGSSKCCHQHITDPRSSSADGIIPDYRGDPEMAIINRTNLITTDYPDVVGDMLKQIGRRNTSKLGN